MRSRDWSSDVCSSDLPEARAELFGVIARLRLGLGDYDDAATLLDRQTAILDALDNVPPSLRLESATDLGHTRRMLGRHADCIDGMRPWQALARREEHRSEEHTSELQSLMRTSYAVFCLKKKNTPQQIKKQQKTT